ncbi:tRNA sulfurtransferase, partial [Haemophilus influenzae]
TQGLAVIRLVRKRMCFL